MEESQGHSNSSYELFVFEDYNQRIVIATVTVIVTIMGSIGNTLIIVSIGLSRRLRSSTNWFIVNLALADFFACLTFPFNAVAMLSRDGWPLPNWICATSSAMFYICLGASVMTLVLIAYNRWYLLTQPIVKFRILYGPRNIFIMLFAAWTYPSLLLLVPHFAGLGVLGYSKEFKSCSQDTSIPSSKIYSLIGGVCVIVPIFITVVVIYVRIYIFVSQQTSAVPKAGADEEIKLEINSHKMSSTNTPNASVTLETTETSRMNVEGTVSDSGMDRADTSSENISKTTDEQLKSGKSLPKPPTQTLERCDRERAQRRVNRYRLTVTKRLAVVVLAFFICMLPFGISVMVPSSEPGAPWTSLLMTVNSCVNPLIYARTMPEFRRVMWAVIRCRFQEIPEPIACIRRRRF